MIGASCVSDLLEFKLQGLIDCRHLNVPERNANVQIQTTTQWDSVLTEFKLAKNHIVLTEYGLSGAFKMPNHWSLVVECREVLRFS